MILIKVKLKYKLGANSANGISLAISVINNHNALFIGLHLKLMNISQYSRLIFRIEEFSLKIFEVSIQDIH